MKRIILLALVCAVAIGIALAQDNAAPASQPSSSNAQGPTSGSSSANQPGDVGNPQPSADRAAPNNQPAAPAQDARADQNAPGRTPTPNGNAGGPVLVWAVVAIVVILGVIFFAAGRGRRNIVIDEQEPIDRDRSDHHRRVA